MQHSDTTAVSLVNGEVGLEQIVAFRRQIREKWELSPGLIVICLELWNH